MNNHKRTQTGPLTGTVQIANASEMTQPPLSEHTLQSAWMYLDDMRGNVSKQNMIDNVAIQYGITPEQAEGVYNEWRKMQ